MSKLKQYLKDIMRTTSIISVSLFLSIGIFIAFAAISWPGSAPSGETAGGKIMTYINNMMATDCATGKAVYGFDTNGAKKCRQVMVEYDWFLSGYSSCNASCGSVGTMAGIYQCRKYDGTYVADSYCSGVGAKPSTSLSCNGLACPPPPPPVYGSCGGAQGMELTTAPTGSQLCNVGSASSVSESGGYYVWSCYGSNGGSTASCSAKKTVVATPPQPTASWEGDSSNGYKYKAASGNYEYPQNCNALLANSKFQISQGTSPWIGSKFTDGYYYIQPISTPVKAYCDMTNNGGGWTRLYRNATTSIDMSRMRTCKTVGGYNEVNYECVNPSLFTTVKFIKGSSTVDVSSLGLTWRDVPSYICGPYVGWIYGANAGATPNAYTMRDYDLKNTTDCPGYSVRYNAGRWGTQHYSVQLKDVVVWGK